MFDNDRVYAVRRLIFDYVRSPSLRHLRDPHSVGKLAEQVVLAVDRAPSVWRKWEGRREDLLKGSVGCWVPLEDLREWLNAMPGPALTLTDVAQRQRAFEEDYSSYADEGLRDGCLELYRREKAEGTELPAIIGALQQYVEAETERRRVAREEAWRRRQEEERLALEQRFLSGADCKWMPIQKSAALFTRKNGRAYRLSPTKDKRWDLFRIEAVEDAGAKIGTYGTRGDASKALAKLAYEPEPRW